MHWLVCLLDDFGGGLRDAHTLGEWGTIGAFSKLWCEAFERLPKGATKC